jgi:excisionase family DNA binding protein
MKANDAVVAGSGSDSVFVGVREAARLVNSSPRTVTNWADTLGLPSYKVGGRRLFDPVEVIAWVKSNCRCAPSVAASSPAGSPLA